MTTHSVIEAKIDAACDVDFLEVLNESHMHGGAATDSHFKITLVSEKFSALSLLKRHQMIYGVLAAELANEVHALALHLYTPAEWSRHEQSSPDSPDCRGGSK